MATQVQFRRGNTAQTAAFTGALAELTVDTEQKTIVVHDGVTAGGTTLATKAFAQAAFNAANTAAGTVGQLAYTHANAAFDKANSANVLAQAAFDAANTAQGTVGFLAYTHANAAFDKANSANVLAQSAYNFANTIAAGAVSNVALTYSNTASGTIPATNTLKPGEPSLNLNDGRMFIQLNNGQIIDISSVATGNTWHVAMNGNDDFKGDTPGSAKRTIRAAVAAANPGDSVIVHSGTYTEITPIIIPQNVQVQGSGERTCIIKPQTTSNNIFYVNNNSYVTGFKFVDYTGAAVSFPTTIRLKKYNYIKF